jgi:hypothetical protein
VNGLLSNPILLIGLVLAAVMPIFNGKTLLQIVLDLLIPKPPAASSQAWEHYTMLAREALARGDETAAKRLAAQAAEEASRYSAQEMQFQPGTIIQWILKLVTGGAGGGLMPLLLIGGVLFLVMGGCPRNDLTPTPAPIDEPQPAPQASMPGPELLFCGWAGSPIPLDPPAPIPLDPEPVTLTVLTVEPEIQPVVAPLPVAADVAKPAQTLPVAAVCDLRTGTCTRVVYSQSTPRQRVYLLRPRTWSNRSVYLFRPRTWRVFR